MSTQADIERAIKSDLPIVFDEVDLVGDAAIKQKHRELLDSSATSSAPFLGAETTRYQSMVLYASAFFIAISLFRIGGIKIGDSSVSVDHKLLVVFAVFLVSIATVFAIKSYVDYLRAKAVWARNDGIASELRESIAGSLLRIHIQQYFWAEFSSVVRLVHQRYSDVGRTEKGEPPEAVSTPTQAFTINRAALDKNLEFRAEIARHDKCLGTLLWELQQDEKRFHEQAGAILSRHQAELEDTSLPFSQSWQGRIRAAHDLYLLKWFAANKQLTDENFDFAMDRVANSPEIKRANDLLSVLKRNRKIRKIYALLEIAMPIALVILALFYVGFSNSAGPRADQQGAKSAAPSKTTDVK